MSFHINDKVSVRHPDWPGIWTVESLGPKNAVLVPQHGGRRLRIDKNLLIDPTTAVMEKVIYCEGELIRLKGRFAGLYVVISDKGGKTVLLAKLGGDNGRRVSAGRIGLVKVDPAEEFGLPSGWNG